MERELFLSGLLGPRKMRGLMERTGTGLESILFSMPRKLDRFADTVARAERRLDFMGRPPLCLHGPYLDLNPITFDDRVRQLVLERFGQAYEAAERLGAKTVVFHSGHVPTVYFIQGWAERMIDFWEEFLAHRRGVMVVMENVYDHFAEPFLEVAEGVRHPDFGLCLDVGHAHCYARDDVLTWANTLAGHIRHVHLHDNDGTADKHRALGDGTVPLEEVVPLLDATNPNPTWTIECSSEEEILRSVDIFQKLLAR